MRLIEKAFADAKNDLTKNWKEFAGDASNPLIKECYAAVDGLGNPEMMDDNEFAWCSCYVNRKIQDAGGRGTRSASARSWLRWGKEVTIKEAKPGDIVIFSRPPSKWQGHVGFIYEITPLWIRVLGGNQSDNVCVSDYRKTRLIGIRTSKD